MFPNIAAYVCSPKLWRHQRSELEHILQIQIRENEEENMKILSRKYDISIWDSSLAK